MKSSGGEVVPVERSRGDRRRHLRWRILGQSAGRIAPNHKASLLDISHGGALIEHTNLIRPGTISSLTLSASKQEINLRCRVVRSLVYRHAVWPTGEQDHVYRTGLEFLALSEDSQQLIDEYIEILRRKQPDTKDEAQP
jgi:c-di-GMP-binding flagellar brake protein YcgR